MKILVVMGDCITVNTSANLCHLAYIQGMIDSGFCVTLLSADAPEYKHDESMKIPESVEAVSFNGITLYEKMSMKKATSNNKKADFNSSAGNAVSKDNRSIKHSIIRMLKNCLLSLYGPHGVYSKIIKTAISYQSRESFDYVISLSTPPSSHFLTYKLMKANHIQAKHWIQIWEDPWFGDAYGFNDKKSIFREEKRLLSFAEKVCYVSPLTLKNRQELFPESEHKMYWQPLPYYYKNEADKEKVFEQNQYGYFGDYAPVSRDLQPFYKAAVQCGISVNICGSPNNLFSATDQIHIHPRLPLNELKPIEDDTNVLVFLCNRHGGQIPGKIYQYSATNKTILFILDGTSEEKQVLKDYFRKFKRYVFCENTVEDITRAIRDIENGNIGNAVNEPVEAFNPKETIRKILACENG